MAERQRMTSIRLYMRPELKARLMVLSDVLGLDDRTVARMLLAEGIAMKEKQVGASETIANALAEYLGREEGDGAA